MWQKWLAKAEVIGGANRKNELDAIRTSESERLNRDFISTHSQPVQSRGSRIYPFTRPIACPIKGISLPIHSSNQGDFSTHSLLQSVSLLQAKRATYTQSKGNYKRTSNSGTDLIWRSDYKVRGRWFHSVMILLLSALHSDHFWESIRKQSIRSAPPRTEDTNKEKRSNHQLQH